ncbi:MAG: DNA-processing protein DprA [Proteobacteria bacterium]|nr:DNA-processing protein DprA [Pseudomonadota bacterium]
MEELTAIIALSRIKGIDRIKKKEIIETTDDLAAVFEGKTKIYDESLKTQINAFKDWKDIEKATEKLAKLGADAITIRDKAYPELLRHIPDPPIVLYKKGPLKTGNSALAIVGSRKATFEGIALAEKIANTLSSLGITIVSGLAKGIDASAHKGALSEEGKTMAVLGCGIDICYPAENIRIFEKIGEEGILLTEYMPGDPPLNYHFPERNRIIAGLSKGILVIEASEKSGALITARLGLEYARDVMAIPGNIFSNEHKGANFLIKQGAKLVDGIEDIIATSFPHLILKKQQKIEIDKDEDYVYSYIGHERIHVDELIDKTGMQAKQVMAMLTRLEMKEIIRGFPGGYYIRK